jgi:hypothetical protein
VPTALEPFLRSHVGHILRPVSIRRLWLCKPGLALAYEAATEFDLALRRDIAFGLRAATADARTVAS